MFQPPRKANAKNGIKTGDGTEVGFFIPLSPELADQFPPLGDTDKSPPHITFLYVGAVPKDKEDLFLTTCNKAFENIREPVRSHLEGLDYFTNPDKERRVAIVRHRFDQDISDARWRLRSALQDAGFEVKDSFPLVYHPHTTLGYLDGLDAEYQGDVPEGDFTFNEIEIWGLPKVQAIPFGDPVQRVARKYMAHLAGVFEEPPAMFDAIWPWVRESFAASILDKLDWLDDSIKAGGEALIERDEVRRECLKYTSGAKTFQKKRSKKFKVDLRGWKYSKSPNEDFEKLQQAWFSFTEILVVLDQGIGGKGNFWNPVLHELHLHIEAWVSTVKDFKLRLQHTEDILRHELTHVGQSVLTNLKEIKEEAGLPSKKLRNPDYDIQGNYLKGWRGFPNYTEHALKDVEFYPDLKDAIAEFLHELPSIPADKVNAFFRTFVGDKGRRRSVGQPNKFFEVWKQDAPAKWKKAVVELMKALDKKGVKVTKVGKTFTLNPGDPILYGKYKNKPGTIKDFKNDPKSGDPVVVVEPYPAGRKQDKELKLFKIRQDDRPREDDAESTQKVASRYISAAIGVADTYLKAYDAFEEQVSIFKESYAPGQYNTKLWLAWSTLWRAGRVWGDYVIDNLAIPRNHAKAIEMVVRAFSKPIPKTYDGGVITKWRDKNIKYLKVLADAADWLTRSAETDVFKVGAFTVHNTLGLDAEELEGVKDVIQRAVAALPRTGLSGMPRMAYGDIFLVGQLNRPKWAAWYVAAKDNIYLRPNMRGVPQSEVARNFVHELGHRFWKKNPHLASDWLTYDTGMRYTSPKVEMPQVGDVLPISVNNKQVRIDAETDGISVLVDTKTGKPVGAVDRGKLYDWMRDVAKVKKFPTIYAAKGGAEEHFCEALSLKAFGDLKEPNLSDFDRVIAGGGYQESVRVAARYQEKKKIKTKDGDDAIVYVYSERQIANRNKAKADRVEKLRQNLGKLQSQIKKDLKSDDVKTRLTALVVGLVNDTYERIGNDQSAKDGHVGVTGWTPEHVKFGKGKATFTYVGKSGVDHVKETTDADLIRVLKEAVKDKKKGDTLFTYEDGKVDASVVNEYLKPFDITAKDIRGLHANREMKERLKAIRSKGGKLPEDKKEREKKLKAEFKEALGGTAEAVGHEPATLKSQYLVPGLEDDFMKDGTVNEKMNKKKASLYREAIIHIDNATDDNDLRGRGGLLSSLTLYESALMEDMLIHKEPIRLVWVPDRKAYWYVLRGHAVNPGAVKELLGSGYLQQDADGDIRVSDMFEAKDELYSHDLTHPGIVIPDEMKARGMKQASSISYQHRCPEEAHGHYRHTCPKCGNIEQCRCTSKQHEGIPVCRAETLCYDCEEELRTGIPQVSLHDWLMARTATKSHAEKEDEAIRDLSRKAPPKKPPRHDLRDEHVDPEEKPSEFGAEGDRDLSLNYKRVAARWVAKIASETAKEAKKKPNKKKPRKPGLKQKSKKSEEHKPGTVWKSENGWSAKNPDGVTHSFSRKLKDKAQAYAQGKQVDTTDEEAPSGEEETKETSPDTGGEFDTEELSLTVNTDDPEEVAEAEKEAILGLFSASRGKKDTPADKWVGSALKTPEQLETLIDTLGSVVGSVEGRPPLLGKKLPSDTKLTDKHWAAIQKALGKGINLPEDKPFKTVGEIQVFLKGKELPKWKKEESDIEDARLSGGGALPSELVEPLKMVNDDFRRKVAGLKPEEQAQVLAALADAQAELKMAGPLYDDDDLKDEASESFSALKGKAKKKKSKGYDDDEKEIFDYSGDLVVTPKELGRMIALANAAREQLADPLNVGGTPVGSARTPEELVKRSKQVSDHYKTLTPEMRVEAAEQMKAKLDSMAEDDPDREEIDAILDGMALAAAINGEALMAGKEYLRPRLAPGLQVLAKILDGQGKSDIFFGSMEEFNSPENRKVIAKALDDLKGPDIAAVLGGEDGPWAELLEGVDWANFGSDTEEEVKQMLRRVALNNITSLQDVIRAISEADKESISGGEPSADMDKINDFIDKWQADGGVTPEIADAFKSMSSSCSMDTPEGIQKCKDARKKIEFEHAMSLLQKLRAEGIELDPNNPAIAVLLDAEKRGDTTGFDGPSVVTEAEFKENGGKTVDTEKPEK